MSQIVSKEILIHTQLIILFVCLFFFMFRINSSVNNILVMSNDSPSQSKMKEENNHINILNKKVMYFWLISVSYTQQSCSFISLYIIVIPWFVSLYMGIIHELFMAVSYTHKQLFIESAVAQW